MTPPGDDAELDAFVDAEPAPSRRPLRPTRMLLLGVLAASLAWFAWPLRDEVAYHFSEQTLVDLGDVSGLPAEMPPPETYVRLTGVLGNKAATLSSGFRPGTWRRGPIQWRQLLGAPIFLEFAEETHKDELGAFTTGSVGVRQVTVEGRLVAMPPGGELDEVRAWFERRYGMKVAPDARVLIVDAAPGNGWGAVITAFGLLLGAVLAILLLALQLLRR